MSTLGELGDTQMREATSNTCTKVPTESISPIHVATDKGGTQQEDQQTAKASNARKPTDSIAHEDEHSVLRQSYNTSGFDDYRSDDCPVSKDSRSSSSSAEVRSARKRDAYIYISSEEEGSSILIANAKPKIPQKKKKMERSLPKKHGVQRRVEDKTIKKSKLRSNKTTTYREEAGNKRQSSPVLRSRVTLRYPGYSSGWSSSDSETCKDSAILTQTTNGDEKEKSGGKLSAPGSTVSTSSWTSSERENENNQTPSSVIDRQLESGGSVDSQMHQGDDITGSDTPGIDIINVKEQQSQANVLSGLNEQQSQASAVSGPNEQQSEANVVSGLNEQQSQANVVSGLDEQQSQANVVSGLNEQQSQASVLSGLSEQQSQANVLSGLNEQQSQADVISDLNEQSLANNVSHPNQKVSLTDILDKQESPGNSISGLSGQESLLLVSEGNAPSICRVEDIPNTLESTPFASDSVDLEVEAQIENTTGEPQDLGGSVASQLEVTVIPETQEDLTDGLSAEPVVQCPGSPVIPLQNKHPDLLSSLHMPVNMTPVGSGRTKTSCVQPSFSDVDSYVLESVASDTSEDQAKDHMRTELLGKVKKWHSKYMCVHSDVGDSFSMTKSGGGQSCVRRRKAKLISRTFGTSHLNKHPYRRGPFRTNLESRLGLLRSDSEFVHPSPHQLTIACRKRKGLKLRKVRDSAASKTESDDQKNQQREVHLPMRSRHSEDEPLVQVKKPNEADSGISSTNLSEIAQSSGTSTSDTQQNPECHAITKVSKPKKRISREVSISSDSECVEFEPPSFKKRKPRPSFAHQRKQKPSTVDEEYNSDETVIIGVDGFDTTTAEKQISTSLCTPKVDLDSEIPGVSAQQPLIEEHLHLKSSDTTVAEESTTDEYASCSMQHENIGQINCSEQKLQSTTKRVLSTRIGRPSGDDTSESSDSSTSDVDKGVKSIDGVKLSARRELDYGISRKLEYNKDKRCTSVDKLSIDNCSSSNDSVDKTKFQEAPGKAAASLSPPSERSDVVKDGPSSFHSEQKETPRGKMKGVTSPKPAHEIVPLSRVVSAPDESEEDSSDSDDDVDVQKTAQQPIGIEQPRESGGRSVCSSPKKSTLHKTLRSYSTCVHGPPRFLFSKSTLKRNYSQQLSELKNPCLKSQGNSESENSTGKCVISRLERIILL